MTVDRRSAVRKRTRCGGCGDGVVLVTVHTRWVVAVVELALMGQSPGLASVVEETAVDVVSHFNGPGNLLSG